jgi:hypothetical protein
MNFKGVLSLGFGVILCLFLMACGGGGSKPAPPKQLTITTSSLPNAAVNAPYNNNIAATGGTGSYSWSVISGSLPPGLTLNATTSFISGTPVQPFGSYSFTVQVKDAAGTTVSQQLSIYVEGAPVISPATLPPGSVGTPYSQTLSATGGLAPYTWCVLAADGTCDATQSELPAGLTLDAISGVISGTPTTPVPQVTVSIQVQDGEKIPASGTIAYKMTVLGITSASPPAATFGIPYTTQLTAAGGAPPYAWTIVSGTLPPGLSLNPASCAASTKTNPCTISGTPSQVGTFPFTVQVQDSETPAAAATAALSITVNLEYTDANLKGNYAFTFTGYKNGNLVVMAGAFVANGDGTFQTVQTSTLCGAAVPPSYTGCLDYNDGSGETGGSIPKPQFIVAATSNYSIGANGLGTMVLTTDQGNSFNFHVSIISDGSGTLIQDNADPDERGSGVIKVQTSSDFNISSLNATFVVGLSGTDNLSKRYAGAGVFRITNGQGDIDCSIFNPLGCPVDVDDAGSLPATTFLGTFSTTVDTSIGRGLFVNLTFNQVHGDVYVYAYYVVSHNELILVSTNPINSLTPFPLTLWSAKRQLTSAQGFNDAVLNGISVMQLNAVDPNGGNPLAQATVGLFTGDGAGNFTFNADVNDGGTSTQQQTSGTYAVNGGQTGTGRVQLTVSGGQPQPVLYMIAANQGFVVGTDPAVTSGYFEPQSGSKFSNISIFGTYSGGTVNPVVSAVTDSVTWLYADGQGNINGTQDTSGPGGPAGPTNFTWTYAVDSTGRAVVSGSYPSVMYVVGPTKVIMLPTSDTNPVLSVLKSAPSN